MKYFFTILLLSNLLFSYELADFYKDYKEKNYMHACKKGVSIFNQYKNDEDYLTVYSFACLKSDMIDRLAVPITGLRKSKEARANASYFAAILLQKKLLYHAVIDNVDIEGLKLPTTDFILSKVFDMYTTNNYIKNNDVYMFKNDNNNDIIYKMFVRDDERFKKLIIQQIKNDTVIKTHNYF